MQAWNSSSCACLWQPALEVPRLWHKGKLLWPKRSSSFFFIQTENILVAVQILHSSISQYFQYYDQCSTLASEHGTILLNFKLQSICFIDSGSLSALGAMIITPQTIGLTGDNYWVSTQHPVCLYEGLHFLRRGVWSWWL